MGEVLEHYRKQEMDEQFQEPTYDQPLPPLEGLNLRELLLGDVNRLRFIHRFNTALVLHRENVAEHSYYVALYAMAIARWVDQYSYASPDLMEIFMRAMVHDMDEARTGDFTRSFKHSTPELKSAIETASKGEALHIFTNLFPGDLRFRSILMGAWEHAKDDSHEGCIIELADYLSVFSHMWHEISCSNVTMLDNYKTMVEYVKKFDDDRFSFMRPLIHHVQRLTGEVLTCPGALAAFQLRGRNA